ncbi:MAG: AraC family transcriptional regulator [Alistipes sp.]|nr:AraC family transcriptional regulator [Alistipes sp.]
MQSFVDNLKPVLLNVGYSEPNKGWNWSDVSSPFARIYYIKGGSAVTNIEGTDHILLPGRFYLTPPFALHHDRCAGPLSLYYIHFFEDARGRQSLFDNLILPVEARAMPGDEKLIDRLLEINPGRHLEDIDPKRYDNQTVFSQNLALTCRLSPHVAVETHGILCQLISRFIGQGGVRPRERYADQRVRRCVAHIHENLDTPLQVSELARICCVTADHLSWIFRRQTGFTPIDYINCKKMERARLLILSTDRMIKDIAGELAIHNVSYFNRLFKRHTGLTPTGYRRARSGII